MTAFYSLSKAGEGWQECTINNISGRGVGLEYNALEKFDIDSDIHLRIYIPEESEPVKIEGKVRWVEQGEEGFNAGIEVTTELDTNRLEGIIQRMIEL